MVYDFKGQYLHDIPLASILHKGSFKVDSEHKMVYCFDVPAGQSPFVWKQDFEGNIKGKIHSYPYTLSPILGMMFRPCLIQKLFIQVFLQDLSSWKV